MLIDHRSRFTWVFLMRNKSERKIGHISEKMRALLIDSKVPKWLWSEALLTSTQLINLLPTLVCGNESRLKKSTKLLSKDYS